MNIRTFIATTLPAMAFFVAQPAAASTLIGQTVDYCTDSTYAGAVSNDPALCDFGSVFVAGTATIDASVEIILDQGGTRRLDFFTDTLDIIYEDVGSFSPDLFVVTGFTAPISGITLISPNPLDVTWLYSGGALGVLVGAPLENGIVTLKFSFDGGMVPEPATWGMMIAGFGLVGFAARRRPVSGAA